MYSNENLSASFSIINRIFPPLTQQPWNWFECELAQKYGVFFSLTYNNKKYYQYDGNAQMLQDSFEYIWEDFAIYPILIVSSKSFLACHRNHGEASKCEQIDKRDIRV